MKEKYIIIENEKGYVTKYGTELISNKPSVVYLRSKIKVTPSIKQPSYEKDIDLLKKELHTFINNEVICNANFNDEFLYTVELSSKSVAFKKISYMRVDLYVKLINPKSLTENQPIIQILSTKIKNKIYNLFEKYNIKCCSKQ